MPDCQSNNGPVATASPSRANKVGNIVVAGWRTRQKQAKNKQQKHICGRKQAIFKAMFYVMPGSVSGEQKAWEKMPGRNSLKPTHIIIIIGGGGGRACRHSPQKTVETQITWRVFNYRAAPTVTKGCRCSIRHRRIISSSLQRPPESRDGAFN